VRELLDELENDSFQSTFNCVIDQLDDAHSQQEFLHDASWSLLNLCKEAADWAQKLLDYREGRYGVGRSGSSPAGGKDRGALEGSTDI
jgi:hypothetical protein